MGERGREGERETEGDGEGKRGRRKDISSTT